MDISDAAMKTVSISQLAQYPQGLVLLSCESFRAEFNFFFNVGYESASGYFLMSQSLPVVQRIPTCLFPCLQVSWSVFPYKLKPVMGPFNPLAVTTLGSVEEVSAC